MTLEQIKSLYVDTIQPALTEPGQTFEVFKNFVEKVHQEEEQLTPEAQAFLEEREEAFVSLLSLLNGKAPDCPESRKMRRLIARFRGKHLDATALVTNFPMLRGIGSILDEGHGVFVGAFQRLLDFMHDVSLERHNGPAAFASISLLYWAVDELTAANFLIRRGYSHLAFPHLRSVMEVIDKLELFRQKPEMADVWASGTDEHLIWRKLGPARVRELLGKDSKDPIYAYFSHSGAHSTFTAIQGRLTRKNKTADVLSVGVGVGGIANTAEQAALMGYCVLFANICLMNAGMSFPDALNLDEFNAAGEVMLADQSKYFESLSISYPEAEANQRSPVMILIRAWREMNSSTGGSALNDIKSEAR